jgi:nucleoside-diphosphate-sugar epimerase
MSRQAFVTGASGFVGSNLVRELHDQGWRVHALLRPSSSLEDIADVPVKIHRGDIVNAASVRDAIPDGVDAVFHMAASTNVWSGNNDEQDRINIGGTRDIIEAAVDARAGRLVHTSSFTTWGFRDATITEHSPRYAGSDWINYVRTKYIAEQLVEEAVQSGRLDAVILNPGHILGPGDRRNWSRMISLVDRGKLPGAPPGSGPFADVREVVKAQIQAFHKGESGEKYLLGGEIHSFMDVIRITGDILGKKVPGRPTPASLMKVAARFYGLWSKVTGREPDLTPESATMICSNLLCDSSRAQRVLGYRFTPLRPLLQETIDWMRNTGMLGQGTRNHD